MSWTCCDLIRIPCFIYFFGGCDAIGTKIATTSDRCNKTGSVISARHTSLTKVPKAVNQSFCDFSQGMVVLLLCSVHNFKMIGYQKQIFWMQKSSRDMIQTWVLNEYPTLHNPLGYWDLLCSTFNSLTPGRSECDSKNVIFNLVLLIGFFRSSHDNAHQRMTQDLADDKSTLVQVMALCHQATSHYLSQCWLSSSSPYGVARSQRG